MIPSLGIEHYNFFTRRTWQSL